MADAPTPRRDAVRRGSAMLALGVNAVLLGSLAWVGLESRSLAQPGGPGASGVLNREPGRYIMVGGAQLTEGADAVYVLDTMNHELVALDWDIGARRLAPIGFRDMMVDRRRDPGR